MKTLVVVLMIIGIIFVAIGFIKTNQNCPPPIIQYRYIPKTFNEEQNTQIPILSIYGKMFSDASPWQENVGYATSNFDKNLRKPENTYVR
jgi:uncharacterized alpha/beta hydrolase family protein